VKVLLILLLATPLYAGPFLSFHVGRTQNKQLPSAFTGGLSYGIEGKNIDVQFKALHIQQKADSLEDGVLTMMPTSLTIHGRIPVKRVFLRLGGGIGYVFTHYEVSEERQRLFKMFNQKFSQEVKDDVAFEISGGVEIPITKGFSIVTDVSYFVYETVSITKRRNMNSSGSEIYTDIAPIDLSSIIGLVSMRIKFLVTPISKFNLSCKPKTK